MARVTLYYAGVNKDFDLPDLAAALAPRPVAVLNAVNPLGHVLRPEAARQAFGGGITVRVERDADLPAAAYEEIMRK